MYILDTHVLLNAVLEPHKLSITHRKIIDEAGLFYFSNISFWEISLKFSYGNLSLHKHNPEFFLGLCLRVGFNLIEISTEEIASYYKLPLVDNHKDPFDRMLIWQCIQSEKILLSGDRKFEQYKNFGLQVIS